MSIHFDGPQTVGMPCVDPFVPSILPHNTTSQHAIDTGRAYPLENFGGGRDDTIIVLPSSDSIRSTGTEESWSSWGSSNTVSTVATSITCVLSKGTSKIWSGLSEIAKPNRTSRASRWRHDGSWPRPRPREESIDLEVGASLPLQTLGEYKTYAGCDLKSSASSEKDTSTSIHLTFDFGYRSHTYELAYTVFRQWNYVSRLVNAMQEDGVHCVLIWDELEELQVMAGDWDAKARPGWKVTVFCDDVNVEDDDYSEADDEKDELWGDKRRFGKEWWFKRWKTRVETKKEDPRRRRNPWLIGAAAMITVTIAFCILVSLREHRPIAMEGGGRLKDLSE